MTTLFIPALGGPWKLVIVLLWRRFRATMPGSHARPSTHTSDVVSQRRTTSFPLWNLRNSPNFLCHSLARMHGINDSPFAFFPLKRVDRWHNGNPPPCQQNDPETNLKKKKNNLGGGAVSLYPWVDLKANSVILTSLLVIVVHMLSIFYPKERHPISYSYAKNDINPFYCITHFNTV